MEHWDRLRGDQGFYWDDGLFRPSTDTFLLGGFPVLRRGEQVCDLGAGTGLLGALLLTREPSLTVTGLELQEDACRLARRTAQRSGWQERLLCRQGDLRLREDLPPMGRFDLVVSNPPYFPPKAGRVSPQETRSVARSEVVCTLEDVCRAAGWLLRWGGRFCVVFPTERLAELLEMARRFGLEPKRLRLVQHDAVGVPGLVLLECRRGGKPGLRAEPTLLLYGPDGRETTEHRRAYFREEEQAL